jgi:hypothetical protein
MNESKKNLVVLRSGDKSSHASWFPKDGKARSFDLMISYYGKSEGRFKTDGEYYSAEAGPKWPILGKLVADQWPVFEKYDAIWFPDDDLTLDHDSIRKFFEIFHEYDLLLAQPSMNPDGEWAHILNVQRPEYLLRFSSMIEPMAPLFSREALRKCHATFLESLSGWGLDYVWPKILGGPKTKIAIIDAVSMLHAGPLGFNPATARKEASLYDVLEKMKVNPWEDSHRILTKYGAVFKNECYGFVARDPIPQKHFIDSGILRRKARQALRRLRKKFTRPA